ncbi:hypothetical protein HAX54_023205 [Datura stramonium]|uniref:Uncharacterized protein n=1 Tax=Datura stramonium TaxID=4076 RepID=A0ABS8S4S8_DATST|nr:hypothetical protein [Datura stramonium]
MIPLNFPGRCASGGEGLMLGCDAPFNPLRVKGASEKGRKKMKADSEDDSDDLSGDRVGSSRPTRPFQRMQAGLAVMRELLGGLPRPLREGHHLV